MLARIEDAPSWLDAPIPGSSLTPRQLSDMMRKAHEAGDLHHAMACYLARAGDKAALHRVEAALTIQPKE